MPTDLRAVRVSAVPMRKRQSANPEDAIRLMSPVWSTSPGTTPRAIEARRKNPTNQGIWIFRRSCCAPLCRSQAVTRVTGTK